MKAHLQDEPHSLHFHCSNASPELNGLIGEFLEKSPEDRIQTATENADRLTDLLELVDESCDQVELLEVAETIQTPYFDTVRKHGGAGNRKIAKVAETRLKGKTKASTTAANQTGKNPKKPITAASFSGNNRNWFRWLLTAAGGMAALLVLAEIIIVIRTKNPDGTETITKIVAPGNSTITMTPGAPPTTFDDGEKADTAIVLKETESGAASLLRNQWVSDDGAHENQPAPAIVPFDADQAKKHQEEWAKYLGLPVEFTNEAGMKFRLIPPGKFAMGLNELELANVVKSRLNHKIISTYDASNQDWTTHCVLAHGPDHTVMISNPYYVSVHEITNARFGQIGHSVESAKGDRNQNLPVVNVSFQNATDFLEQLHPVGLLQANGFGIHDCVGNAFDWCSDYFSFTAYHGRGVAIEPFETRFSTMVFKESDPRFHRVCRGTSIISLGIEPHFDERAYWHEDRATPYLGFRVIIPIELERANHQTDSKK